MFSVASQAGLIHLGMDTPKSMIVVAMLFPGAENPVTERVANEEAAIRRASRFADRSVLRCWYEAGPGVMSGGGYWPRWGWRARWWHRR